MKGVALRHDELGRLLRVLRLPDVDSADGPDADHDVVHGAKKAES